MRKHNLLMIVKLSVKKPRRILAESISKIPDIQRHSQHSLFFLSLSLMQLYLCSFNDTITFSSSGQLCSSNITKNMYIH
jgi:hypothetical protein